MKKEKNNRHSDVCRASGILVNCWWEQKMIQLLWKRTWKFLKRLKIKLPCDPSITLLSIGPKEVKAAI